MIVIPQSTSTYVDVARTVQPKLVLGKEFFFPLNFPLDILEFSHKESQATQPLGHSSKLDSATNDYTYEKCRVATRCYAFLQSSTAINVTPAGTEHPMSRRWGD